VFPPFGLGEVAGLLLDGVKNHRKHVHPVVWLPEVVPSCLLEHFGQR
jgi:hypothetical protein